MLCHAICCQICDRAKRSSYVSYREAENGNLVISMWMEVIAVLLGDVPVDTRLLTR